MTNSLSIKRGQIKRGERYVRPEDAQTVWIIERLIELQGLPMHARMVVENRHKKTMTMSEVALRNRKLYKQLASIPQEELLAKDAQTDEKQKAVA